MPPPTLPTAHLPSHLIIVCCHGIYLGPDTSGPKGGGRTGAGSEAGDGDGGGGRTGGRTGDGPEARNGVTQSSSSFPSDDEKNWLIEPFQKGEVGTYVRHIEAGVRELAGAGAVAGEKENYEKNGEKGMEMGMGIGNAILVFSGGATKRDKTAKTEGEGYLDVAIERNFFGLETSPPTLRPRTFVDHYAADSYQNVLCSIIQFPLFVHELLARLSPASGLLDSTTTTNKQSPTQPPTQSPLFPTKITIISHEFKRSRFLNLHLPALRWTRDTAFIGINPPFDSVKMAEIEQGDRLRGYGAWLRDLYGSKELLAAKRKMRGWDEDRFRRDVLGRLSGELELELEGHEVQQIGKLLAWTGGEDGSVLCPGRMPWE